MTSVAAGVYRTPDERFADLPGWRYEPRYAEVGGLRMAYIDEGPRDAEQTVVCFHGEPDWGYLYRKLTPVFVAAGHRVVVPDLAGFGRSDKPVERDWYSYDNHYAQLAGVLDAADVSAVTAIVQDWGGPLGLRWAVEHEARTDRLVIMNTGLFTGRVSKGFSAWRDFAERQGLDLPIGMIMQGATATELPDDVVGAYEAPFPQREGKMGAAMFPLLVPLSEDDPVAAKMQAVSDALTRWSKPCLVAFSDSDPVFPYPRSGEVFCAMIPGAGEQVCIEGAAHFLQEDRGEQIAGLVVDFMAR